MPGVFCQKALNAVRHRVRFRIEDDFDEGVFLRRMIESGFLNPYYVDMQDKLLLSMQWLNRSKFSWEILSKVYLMENQRFESEFDSKRDPEVEARPAPSNCSGCEHCRDSPVYA